MNNNEKIFNNMKQSYRERSMPKDEFLGMLARMSEAEHRNRVDKRKKCAKIALPLAACLALVFFALPNVSEDMAMAMSKVPGMKKVVEVATIRDYDDSMKKAVVEVPEASLSMSSEEERLTLGSSDMIDVKDSHSEEAQLVTSDVYSFSNKEVQIGKIVDKLLAEFRAGIKNASGYGNVATSAKVVYTGNQYFSVKITCCQPYENGASWKYFYTIRLSDGNIVSMDEIFKNEPDYKVTLCEEIENQIEIREEEENVVFWNKTLQKMDDNEYWKVDLLNESTQFYFNQDGNLVIYYEQGEVAPVQVGEVRFEIPQGVLEVNP